MIIIKLYLVVYMYMYMFAVISSVVCCQIYSSGTFRMSTFANSFPSSLLAHALNALHLFVWFFARSCTRSPRPRPRSCQQGLVSHQHNSRLPFFFRARYTLKFKGFTLVTNLCMHLCFWNFVVRYRVLECSVSKFTDVIFIHFKLNNIIIDNHKTLPVLIMD